MAEDFLSLSGSWWVSSGARRAERLPGGLDRSLERSQGGASDARLALVVALASEILAGLPGEVLGRCGMDTFYLVFMNLPLPAAMRLPTLLGLHKPDRRLHLTREMGALRRLVIARNRAVPMEGILDAYVLDDELVLVLGDLTIRSFPRERVPEAGQLTRDRFVAFEIDPDGSYLRWTDLDIDLGVSGLLQAVDPSYLADVEIDRLSRENTAEELARMRADRGLRQRDVPGLSERQVRRLEKGTSRLTADAARQYAAAFGLSLNEFLNELSRAVGALSEPAELEELGA